MVQVYKFGGSSLKNSEGIRNLRQIVGDVDQSLVLVVSALGKTTNALEEVVQSSFEHTNTWRQKLDAIREFHEIIASDLLPDPDMFLYTILRPSFDALARKLEEPPAGSFDFFFMTKSYPRVRSGRPCLSNITWRKRDWISVLSIFGNT